MFHTTGNTISKKYSIIAKNQTQYSSIVTGKDELLVYSLSGSAIGRKFLWGFFFFALLSHFTVCDLFTKNICFGNNMKVSISR